MRTAIVCAAIAAICALILILGAGDQTGPNAFVVIGISQGAIYGLLAIGLVLVYKGARVFNFAQGEFGTLAAFTLYLFNRQYGLPYWVGVIAAVVITVLIGLAMERVVVRPLLEKPRVTLLVATIAFALLAIGFEFVIFLPELKNLEPIVHGQGITIFTYILDPQHLIIIGVLLALAVILGFFFSRTDLGLAILGTSQDAFATRVVGIGIDRISPFIWGSAAFLGAIAGILYVPTTNLVPGVVTLYVLIPAFTAAVLGGMTSLPGAFVGGVAVGLIQALSQWASGHYSIGDKLLQGYLPDIPDVVLLVALLTILLARPQGLLGTEA
ncbi:MAG: branched-chain amino acid transport system permease protein [Actinomycetota bacterium]|nr:branched-chain amino acid transport system permease protein [Actinomycetota bacterium]